MANLNSTLYAKLFVNKYLGDPREYRGAEVLFPIEHTVGSDVNADTVNVTEVPVGYKVTAIDVAWDALGAATTLSIGDAGSATRYLAATAVTSAGRASGPSATTGQNFVVTAGNTVIRLTWGGANPTAAATVKGVIRAVAPS